MIPVTGWDSSIFNAAWSAWMAQEGVVNAAVCILGLYLAVLVIGYFKKFSRGAG